MHVARWSGAATRLHTETPGMVHKLPSKVKLKANVKKLISQKKKGYLASLSRNSTKVRESPKQKQTSIYLPISIDTAIISVNRQHLDLCMKLFIRLDLNIFFIDIN